MSLAAGLLCLASACTVDKAETLQPSGPSELGLSLSLQATPDVITQDGASQAQVVIQARGPNSQPLRDIACRLDIIVNGVVADYGRLSSKTVVTDGNGRAAVSYTAPAGLPTGNTDSGNVVSIMAIPIGYDYANAVARSVDIRLVPLGVILPPNGTPVASFIYSPTDPREDDTVQFDGSSSQDDGTITSYTWDFGDGTTGSGVRTTHKFKVRGSYTVTLTVTDDRGQSATKSISLDVSGLSNPTASFTASPGNATVGQSVFFNASASQAQPGRTLVSYDWTFGDGGTGSGVTTSRRYGREGTYAVTLTVTDDSGRTGTVSNTVSVGVGLTPSASFTWSPTSPLVGQTVNFNAGTSTAPSGRTIAAYEWNFGDGATDAGQTVTHRYNTAGDFTVVLTLVDSTGARSTKSEKVTVVASTAQSPTANFVISPSPARRGSPAVFDASSSVAFGGFSIATYDWSFGDSAATVRCPGDPACGPSGRTILHTYAIAATYTITLTVTDGNNRTATTSKTLVVDP